VRPGLSHQQVPEVPQLLETEKVPEAAAQVRWLQRQKPSQRLLENIEQRLLGYQLVVDYLEGNEEY